MPRNRFAITRDHDLLLGPAFNRLDQLRQSRLRLEHVYCWHLRLQFIYRHTINDRISPIYPCAVHRRARESGYTEARKDRPTELAE